MWTFVDPVVWGASVSVSGVSGFATSHGLVVSSWLQLLGVY